MLLVKSMTRCIYSVKLFSESFINLLLWAIYWNSNFTTSIVSIGHLIIFVDSTGYSFLPCLNSLALLSTVYYYKEWIFTSKRWCLILVSAILFLGILFLTKD